MSSTRDAMATAEAARAVRRRNSGTAARADLDLVAAMIGENCEELRGMASGAALGRDAECLLDQIEAWCRELAGK